MKHVKSTSKGSFDEDKVWWTKRVRAGGEKSVSYVTEAVQSRRAVGIGA